MKTNFRCPCCSADLRESYETSTPVADYFRCKTCGIPVDTSRVVRHRVSKEVSHVVRRTRLFTGYRMQA